MEPWVSWCLNFGKPCTFGSCWYSTRSPTHHPGDNNESYLIDWDSMSWVGKNKIGGPGNIGRATLRFLSYFPSNSSGLSLLYRSGEKFIPMMISVCPPLPISSLYLPRSVPASTRSKGKAKRYRSFHASTPIFTFDFRFDAAHLTFGLITVTTN